MKHTQIKTIAISSLISTLLAVTTTTVLQNTVQPNPTQQAMGNYYHNSVATLQSPHGYREQMHRGYTDYTLVDTRAHADYVAGHITGAINIDSSTSTEILVQQFKDLQKINEKPILIYCYSTSCMNGRKIGAVLADHGVYVHELTVGYNEWEFYPQTWNYPEEWESLDIEEYVTRGEEPGTLEPWLEKLLDGCGVSGELSC